MDSFWKNRIAFVTGATGFVGAHTAKMLLEKGAKVICLQRDTIRPNTLDLLGLREKVTIVGGSVEDFSLMERILNEYEPDAVFHLASQALLDAANRSPLNTFETNIRGTYLLFEACRRAESVKRIVFASSVKAYGYHSQVPYTEEFPLQGTFPYDVSKSCADLLAFSFAHSYKLPVTVSRSANIYGAGDLNFSRIVPGTIQSVLKNQNPIIRGDGMPVREFIFVEDVCQGILLLAENIEKSQANAYNLASCEPVKMIDLVELILETSSKKGVLKPEILNKNRKSEISDEQYLTGEKILKEFGWKQQTDLRTGLKKTFDWYRENFTRLI